MHFTLPLPTTKFSTAFESEQISKSLEVVIIKEIRYLSSSKPPELRVCKLRQTILKVFYDEIIDEAENSDTQTSRITSCPAISVLT